VSKDSVSIGERITIVKHNPKGGKDRMNLDSMNWTSKLKLEKYNNDESLDSGLPDEVVEIEGNTALDLGLNTIWKLVNGQSSSDGVYQLDSINTHVGVGNSSATAQSSQSGLLGSNKFYAPMDNSTVIYPVVDNNVLTVRAKFGPADANFTWNEWGILNGNPDNPGSRDPSSIVQFNRKVEPMGSKVEGSTWIIIAELIINAT